jgi:ABC-type antimicrobial peptide transport system permease subunit
MTSYLQSFNKHQVNYDNIYRIVREADTQDGGRGHTTGVAPPTLDALNVDYPLLDEIFMISEKNGSNLFEFEAHNGETKFFEENNGIAYTENGFFKTFTRPLLKGSADKALLNPNEIVLSEKLAAKFFGDESAINKLIKLDKDTDLTVVGIMADYLATSDFPFEAFISYQTIKDTHVENGWGSVSSGDQVYMLINDQQEVDNLRAQIPDFVEKYYPENEGNLEMHIQPMSDFHFNQDYPTFSYNSVSEGEIMVMWIIGIFLIITACINFVNLSTAIAVKRSKEIGIRKVLGSTRTQLVKQHLGETFMVTLISVLISLGLAELGIIKLNAFLETQIEIHLLTDMSLQIYLVSVLILVTLFSGFYPAVVISNYSPVMAMKNLMTSSNGSKISLRKSLVVFQFWISQIFIIGTIIVMSQLDYIKDTDLGFKTEGVINVDLPERNSEKKKTLYNELSRISGVELISLAYTNPTSGSVSMTNVSISEDPEDYDVEIKLADHNYLNVFGIDLLAGTNVNASDTITSVLVNEEFIKLTDHQDPNEIIGKMIKVWGDEVPIAGVINDFHSRSLTDKKSPVVLFSRLSTYRLAAIKINTNNLVETTNQVERVWKTVYPEYNYEFEFMDDQIAEFYESEEQMATIISTFSGIAILIGCLGLFGLASYMVNQKVKEIGVRKVLGASVNQILMLFGKEFVKLIFISFLIAAPFAYFGMDMWLENYENHIEIGPWVFTIAVGSTLLIALLTVGAKTFKAATVNPVNSLQDE